MADALKGESLLDTGSRYFGTGTPGGVGLFMQPPGFIVDGDVVEVEVSKLGTLRNTVRDIS
ncbi:fumarylacetoacetate hydrolase family protein [Streptacidiphilus griseoplanus]|uniref:fumarylacetoacetate hydrolase family protein n=1 Tax=Peterkaempfera griseoplana TaxID=66896 RepID=UPI0006E274D3|nr:fumarylacetoacetate hydrolase family protein [Peterkaempfera griseoplana]